MKESFLIYVHGLNSGPDSAKWKAIKTKFDDSHLVAWPNDETFDIQKVIQEIDHVSKTVFYKYFSVHLVGDSTGANFVMQYQDSRLEKISHYSLISPLICREQILIDTSIFHKKVYESLVDFKEPYSSLVFRTPNDKVLDQTWKPNRCGVEEGNGDHARPLPVAEIAAHIEVHSRTIHL